MDDLDGKVAVITGAASGIGRAMASGVAAAGMKVVLADVEPEALDRAVAELEADGAAALGVVTDVSDAASVDALADVALSRFGAVHLLHNNAGVGLVGAIWQNTLADWQWLIGVNLWGVIHGVRTFVPIMLDQGGDGHVVNTASMAGLTSPPYLGAYNVTKHGVVALSETLARDLDLQGSGIGVSVLCPGVVHTAIGDSARNRPADLQNPDGTPVPVGTGSGETLAGTALAPSAVADQVIDAVRTGRFYVITHPAMLGGVRARMDDILLGRQPGPGYHFG